jgi:hypothetical protein
MRRLNKCILKPIRNLFSCHDFSMLFLSDSPTTSASCPTQHYRWVSRVKLGREMVFESDSVASSNETVLVGYIGFFLFFLLFLISAFNYYQSNSSKLISRLFFLFMSLMAVFELPRYILMIITQNYHSQWGYSCHILANYFFFLLITIVIWILMAVLELDLQQQILIFLYSKHGIYGINIVLFISSLIEITLCLLSPSLESYFDSLAYEIYSHVQKEWHSSKNGCFSWSLLCQGSQS